MSKSSVLPISFHVVPVFSQLCNLAFSVRREVFVIEQNVPVEEELDAYDFTATHIVGIVDGNVIATMRIIYTEDYAKFGRVAVSASGRGHGYGRDMIKFALEHIAEQGQPKAYLGSQSDKVVFYEKLGFTAYGEEFLDANIPHRHMKNY